MFRNIPCLICIVLITLLIGFIIWDSNKHKCVVNIAVGTPLGAYATYADAYKKELKKYDISLNIIYTDGSMDAQSKLMNEEVDFAFIQSGTQRNQPNQPLVLANVAYEPIWIFYKDKKIQTLEDLTNRTVNLGNKNSGTYPIASQLMNLVLNPSQPISFDGAKDAFNKLQKNQIDAMFYVIGIKSSRLQTILHTPNISILNFKNAQSYRKFFIQQDEYYEIVTIEKNALDLVRKIPETTKILLAKTTMLVTKKASAEMSRLFLKIAKKVHSKTGFLKSENTFPNVQHLKLSQSEASKDYFQEPEHSYELIPFLRHHYWLAQTLKYLEDMVMSVIVLLGLIAFFIEVIYPISKMITRWKINKWYKRVNKIDTHIDKLSLDELKSRKKELEKILTDMQDNDKIDPVHLEAYYSIQHQITNILEDFERRIKEKQAIEILV